MSEEIWKTIAEWPNYEVSSCGRVRRLTSYKQAIAGTFLRHFLSMVTHL